jgi:hypothetical protein
MKYGKGYVTTNINEIQWIVNEYYYNTYNIYLSEKLK